MQIMLVDDSPVLRLLLRRQLEALGLSVRERTPAELDAAAEPAGPVFVELQLLSAAGNGFALLRKLAAAGHAPLVLLSGTARETDRLWALRTGATAVLTRPLHPAALRDLLRAQGLYPPQGQAS